MRPIRIGGRRVICPMCRCRYATARVLGTITCGRCLRALFIGYMTGKNSALDEIYKKYELKKRVKE